MPSQPATLPSSRSMLSRDKRLPLDSWNTSGLQENVFGNQFSTFHSPPRSSFKEFTLAHRNENEDQFHKLQGRGLFSQQMTNIIETQVQCRHLQEGRRLRVLSYRWIFRRILWLDNKYRRCNSTNSLIHDHFWFGRYDSKIK